MKVHHHTMFGYKRLSSEDIVLTNLILTPRQTDTVITIYHQLYYGEGGAVGAGGGGYKNPSYISI